MIKNKGFTLIEILAVITIIGIIALLTVPIVDRVIQGTGNKVFKTNEQSLATAAEDYYMSNMTQLPPNLTDRGIIYLDDLVASGYIKQIKDIKNKDNNCDGYVIIEKTKNYMYDYTPYLNCSSKFMTDGYYETPPVIKVTGVSPMNVLLNSTYTDLGATAIDITDGDITANITTTNNVNTSVLGTYTVNYSITNSLGITSQESRTVNVKSTLNDTTAPVITLLGVTPITINKGTTYTDPGATAFDDVDGNITSNIVVNNPVNTAAVGTYTVTYDVSDSFGNKATTVVRKVKVISDTTAPVITLVGSNNITVDQGATYVDAGATATDNIDGDITNRIVVVNPVNTMAIGTYTITYNVTDSVGNHATQVTRTVNVTSDYLASKGANKPRLITGMTPIKWNGSAWVDTTESDTTWYDYSTTAKQWANARTADGSMWVWIPRYAYQIATNYHTSTVGTINVKFLQNNTNTASDSSTVTTIPTYSGSSQTNYILHPAFTFGSIELTGIWVAKFETSVSNTGDACYTNENDTNCNKTTLIPKIIPNVKSWRYIDIGNMFTVSRNMETNNTYGWGTTGTGLDTHLMKNTEWGAVTYLSQSTYGKNSELWINNSNIYTTGCSGGSASATNYAGCQYAYNTTNGLNASTTGNIYGIYDISGGAYEPTAAYVNNGNSALTTYGNNIISADSKYKDVYSVTTDDQTTNYNNTSPKKGDAVYETSSSYTGSNSWNTDFSYMTYGPVPWFVRGGNCYDGSGTGVFHFGYGPGGTNGGYSFRPVLLVGIGL